MGHPIPEGHHAITPHLVVKGAAEAIDFYKRALGAEEVSRMPMPGPDGTTKIGHADLKIGGSHIFLADEFPEYGAVGPAGPSPVVIHLYVEDVDAAFARAIEAGATATMPPQDTFWGDRYGKFVDPFGHHWSVAEQLEALTPDQMRERMAQAMGSPSCD